MASFVDKVTGFNPYISQLPVDDYVRVGMIKQDQYDQGVQKVEGYIQSIAGMEVVKPEQQAYLKQVTEQLQNQAGKLASQDFSNNQIVGSVGAMASKMAADPILSSAVASTQKYKAGLASMKAAREKGESSASNEWAFQNQVQKWMTDGDAATSFNGEFIKYTDVNKKIADIIKELKPGSTVEDIPYQRGGDGRIALDKNGQPLIDYAMLSKKIGGVTPERVSQAIRANLNPNDMRQLQMDGAYNYRGYDKNGLKQLTDSSYDYKLEQVNDEINSLLVKRRTNISDVGFINKIDERINMLKEKGAEYQENYKRDVDALDKNPEGYKSNLYMENWLSRFSDGYSYADNSLTYKDNPYFQGAMKEREFNLNFQKFLDDRAFKEEELAIKREELTLKAKEKKADDPDGAPLPLAGTSVASPINQAELEKINESTFLNETKAMSDGIDMQKMQLLAQVRPDLVTIVRDPDGSNPRYEYNVAGKDPNKVKAESDATINALKDSYDKGEQVEDGVKTYFDNLGITKQRVDNRKQAINQLQTEAGKKYNVSSLLANIPDLYLNSGSGTNYTVTGEQIMNFNEKLKTAIEIDKAIMPGQQSGVRYNDEKAKGLMVSPTEKLLYSILTKRNPTEDERKIITSIGDVGRRVNGPNYRLLNERTSYVNSSVREIVGATQPTAFQVEAFKGEDRNRARAVLNDVYTDIVRAGKGNAGVEFDKDRVNKMLNSTNEATTTYSLISNGGDNYALRLNNPTVSESATDIQITKAQAVRLFGQEQFLDQFQAIREALQLSKASGKVTTDVSGQGASSAFTLKNPGITNYGVKYHVEEPLKNGGLQVRLYIYDKETGGGWKETPVSFGSLLNETQVLKYLSKVDDNYFDALLKKQK